MKFLNEFVIECPECHSYATAKRGIFGKLFGTKKIRCACGHDIVVEAEKAALRNCPSCFNNILIDQSQGDKAVCPICNTRINTPELLSNTVAFHCPSCSCELLTNKPKSDDDTYSCPLCDTEINIRKQLAMEELRSKGQISVIKYEGATNKLIWKHPIEDFNYGSKLIVDEWQEAFFDRDGHLFGPLGKGTHILDSQNFPGIRDDYSITTNSDTPFHCKVYFANLSVQMALMWGTPNKISVIDPITKVPLEISAFGNLNVCVKDSRRLLVKLVGSANGISWENEGDDNGSLAKELQKSFLPHITSAAKISIPASITDNNINLLAVDSQIGVIQDDMLEKLLPVFEEYGLTVSQLYVQIKLPSPQEDPNVKQMKMLQTVELQTMAEKGQARIKTEAVRADADFLEEKERQDARVEVARRDAELERQSTQTEIARREAERKIIEAQAKAAEQKLKGIAEAEIMERKGYNERDVIQAEVQKAYAAGIGNMNISGGSGGVVGDMMGLGIGLSAMGKIAPQLENIFGTQAPVQNAVQPNITPAADSWNCSCGNTASGAFCNLCGSRKPTPNPDTWQCSCGNMASGMFCNMCGSRRISDSDDTWKCSCGNMVKGKFCNMCGSKKPQSELWDCSCGNTGIKGMFCNDCGKKRGD